MKFDCFQWLLNFVDLKGKENHFRNYTVGHSPDAIERSTEIITDKFDIHPVSA
jgi:hypothetical protein